MKLKTAIKQLKKFLIEGEDLHLVGHDNTSGIDIRFTISSIKRENNAVVLRGTNKSSQHLYLIRKRKACKNSVDVPVENWDCPYVRETHRLQVLKFLKEGGLGEGNDLFLPRGFTPSDLRKALSGNEIQMRESLNILDIEGKIIFTGTTKSKKYCHIDYKLQAEANFQKEQEKHKVHNDKSN